MTTLRFTRMLYAALFSALVLAIVWGCGNGTKNAVRNEPGTVGLPSGGVSGLLATGSNGKGVLIYGAPPPGFTPLAGAILSVAGGPSVTTAADGTFMLAGIPVGSRTLQIRPKSGRPFAVPLTIVPAAIVRTGNPPITRTAAMALVKQALTAAQALTGSGIWAPQQPLPPAVKIGSALWGDDPRGPSVATASSQWLVYVDPGTGLRFGHDVLCYLVNVQTGTLSTLNSDSWPSLNGFPYYRPTQPAEASSPTWCRRRRTAL